MKEIIEDMTNLCDGIETMTEYVFDTYGEFSDEYDFVERVNEFAKVILENLKQKAE